MPPDQHQKHIDAARQRLAHLAAMAHGTAEAEKRIAEAATQRLATVEAGIARARPKALTDDRAGESYTALIQERAHLHEVRRRAGAVA